MPIPTYTPGYPPDGSSLGQTKAVIRNNLDGTFQTLAVDHVDNNGQPGSNPAGYHTIVHQVTQTNVDTVTGVNQIFSGVPGTLVVDGNTTSAIPSNGDTQLYALTGAGGLQQLTGSSSGFAWCSGVLIQWGRSNIAAQTGSVNFPETFPTNVYVIQMTLQIPGGGPAPAATITRNYLEGNPVDLDKFFYRSTTIGADVYVNWVAIGN